MTKLCLKVLCMLAEVLTTHPIIEILTHVCDRVEFLRVCSGGTNFRKWACLRRLSQAKTFWWSIRPKNTSDRTHCIWIKQRFSWAKNTRQIPHMLTFTHGRAEATSQVHWKHQQDWNVLYEEKVFACAKNERKILWMLTFTLDRVETTNQGS